MDATKAEFLVTRKAGRKAVNVVFSQYLGGGHIEPRLASSIPIRFPSIKSHYQQQRHQ